MTKANSVEDIFNTFLPENVLTAENEEFYVDIFKEDMKEFAVGLQILRQPKQTYLIAGQSGNGKSSALNMLSTKYPKLKEKYNFMYVAGREAFKYIKDIDIVDILFNIAYSIIKDDDDLKSEIIDKLKELEKIYNNELEKKISKTSDEKLKSQLKTKLGVGAKILTLFEARGDFTQAYNYNNEAREDAIEIFKVKKQKLLDIVNELILNYKIKHKKEIVVVIDDIEKRDDVDHLFKNEYQLPLLNDLNIIKIITMPVHLKRTIRINFGEFKEFGLKLKNSDGSENNKDKALLKEVVYKRIASKDLISSEAIDIAVEQSGANMNQLVSLIHKSALKALVEESNIINKNDIENAIHDLRRDLSSFVMNQRSFLQNIREKSVAVDDEHNMHSLSKSISNNIVFAYFNSNTWYEINPVCNDSLDFYIERDKETT